MIFKIDTKEKFTVITPMSETLSDNLTAELIQTATNYLQKDIKNMVLNLGQVQSLDEDAATHLVKLEQTFYENNASFVICEIQQKVTEQLEKFNLLELVNVTPTESEAGDIVQMEEIERELMENDNPSFDSEENE
jgi:anti-anti-sigma regulatory factor